MASTSTVSRGGGFGGGVAESSAGGSPLRRENFIGVPPAVVRELEIYRAGIPTGEKLIAGGEVRVTNGRMVLEQIVFERHELPGGLSPVLLVSGQGDGSTVAVLRPTIEAMKEPARAGYIRECVGKLLAAGCSVLVDLSDPPDAPKTEQYPPPATLAARALTAVGRVASRALGVSPEPLAVFARGNAFETVSAATDARAFVGTNVIFFGGSSATVGEFQAQADIHGIAFEHATTENEARTLVGLPS